MFSQTPQENALRPILVGKWRSELQGTDLAKLEPVDEPFIQVIALNQDGTAEWDFVGAQTQANNGGHASSGPPFPITWDLSYEIQQHSLTDLPAVLSVYVPVAPLPEYDLPDWSQDAKRWHVIEVTEDRLVLSDRAFDGEFITVFRRV
jgi:hypothetical protein